MSVSIHNTKDELHHISIIGELDNSEDMKSFLSILKALRHTKIQINFWDATILNDRVIELLAEYQSDYNCRINVTKPFLYSYLQSLSIYCNYLNTKHNSISAAASETELNETELSDELINAFLHKIFLTYGYDYRDYQLSSIKRRIKISMLRENISNFTLFEKLSLESQRAFEQLFLDFSINTTSFFRDPEIFTAIKNSVLPYLSSYPHIRIWCVGCSTGNEPYSLAILLKEAGLLEKSQIYATDINPFVIEEAKNGLYSLSALEEGIINYRKYGGNDNFTNYFHLRKHYIKIREEFKKNILFFQHSLLERGLINEFQLILCRNVLIYFKPNLQKDVLEYLSKSLSDNGFLVLGTSEGMLQNDGYKYFNRYDEKCKIYKKIVL